MPVTRLTVPAVLAALLLAGCNSPSHNATPAPGSSTAAPAPDADSPSPDPTDARSLLGLYLDDASAAEETWLQSHDNYTTSIPDLLTTGFRTRDGYTLTATAQGSDTYCLVSKAPDGTVRSYVNALSEDDVDGYLYDSDVCTSHAPGAPYPSPMPSPAPTGSAAVDQATSDVADAEETYFSATNMFTPDLATLTAQGYAATPGVAVTIHLIGTDAYCIEGTGMGTTRHYDSQDADTAAGPCPSSASPSTGG